MNALVIVQARMGSTRLPGKVEERILGMSVLEIVCRAVIRAGLMPVVAAANDGPWDWTNEWRVPMGIELIQQPDIPDEDVLARFWGMWSNPRYQNLGPILRLTADCPFVPPSAIRGVANLIAGDTVCGYAESRSDPSSRPNGIDVQAFSPAVLGRAYRATREDTRPLGLTPAEERHGDDAYWADELLREQVKAEREHLTPALKSAAGEGHRCTLLEAEGVLLDSLPPIRLTLDTPDDLLHLRAIADRIGLRPTMADLATELRRLAG